MKPIITYILIELSFLSSNNLGDKKAAANLTPKIQVLA